MLVQERQHLLFDRTPAEGVPESPLEPLVAQAREEGYPVDSATQGPRPYQGYYFRILTGQGPTRPRVRATTSTTVA